MVDVHIGHMNNAVCLRIHHSGKTDSDTQYGNLFARGQCHQLADLSRQLGELQRVVLDRKMD